jgi:hypothetical protein
VVRSTPTHRRRIRTIAVATSVIAGLVPGVLVSTQSANAIPSNCQAGADGALFVTPTCVDPSLSQPVTDLDQQRMTTDPVTGVTVSYRYIHGYFADHPTAKFAFYFPDASAYKGRFFEETYPTVSVEDAAPSDIAFAITHGAYAVTTNNDGGVQNSPTLGGYRVNAAAAKYSKTVEATVYPSSPAPRGYIYGASGGGYQTLGALENTQGIWDGGVPMVPAVPDALPSFGSIALLALRVLHNKLPQIVRATQPGGNGNPFKGLTPTQKSVLKEAMTLGVPVRSLWQYKTLAQRVGGEVAAVGAAFSLLDATYVSDFWSKPGYEGHDSASVKAARVQTAATVASMNGSTLMLTKAVGGPLESATLTVTSGPYNGQSTFISSKSGAKLTLGGSLPALTAGTTVSIDNSTILAMEYYQRHSLPPASSGEYGWNQYRDGDGNPKEPQRAFRAGPLLAASAAGSTPTGLFHGKMIMLASTMDAQAYPWSVDWYRKQIATLGLTSSYRLWISDNADHDPFSADLNPDYVVPYSGEMYQALLDLDAWVANGKAPAATTKYTVNGLDQVSVTAPAKSRGGLQPTLSLLAHTKHTKPTNTITIHRGGTVRFEAKAATPKGAGRIVKVEWDFTGSQKFIKGKLAHVSSSMTAKASHVYKKRGTYYVTVRVSAERSGNAKAPYTQVKNLARVRVVVL